MFFTRYGEETVNVRSDDNQRSPITWVYFLLQLNTALGTGKLIILRKEGTTAVHSRRIYNMLKHLHALHCDFITMSQSSAAMSVSLTPLIRTAYHIYACGISLSYAPSEEAAVAETRRARQQRQANVATAVVGAALQAQREQETVRVADEAKGEPRVQNHVVELTRIFCCTWALWYY